MLEIGKKYVCRDGKIRTVIGRSDSGITSTIIDDNGKTHILFTETGHANELDRYPERTRDYDVIKEYTDLKWEYTHVYKDGIWAYGGNDKLALPRLAGIESKIRSNAMAWRCYLGPIPIIQDLKRERMWLVKTNLGNWQEIWAVEEPNDVIFVKVIETKETRLV